MQVRVTKLGYYDLKRRSEGEILNIEPKLFSEKWMEKIDGEKPAPRKAKAQVAKQHEEHPSDEDVI